MVKKDSIIIVSILGVFLFAIFLLPAEEPLPEGVINSAYLSTGTGHYNNSPLPVISDGWLIENDMQVLELTHGWLVRDIDYPEFITFVPKVIDILPTPEGGGFLRRSHMTVP